MDNQNNNQYVNQGVNTIDNQNSSQGTQVMNNQSSNQSNEQVKNQYVKNYQEKNNKMKETFAQLSFLFSLIGLLLSLFGSRFGFFIYAAIFYFASAGMRTKKKSMAIAAIIITVISFIIAFTPLLG